MVLLDGLIYSIQNSGGISRVFDEIIQRLNRDDLKLYLYGEKRAALEAHCEQVILNSRPYERMRQFRCPSGSADVVFHSTYYRTAATCVPTICTVHDLITRQFSFRSNLLDLIRARAIKKADKIICVSNYTKSLIEKRFGDEIARKCKVIYNSASATFRDLGMTRGEYVLFVGGRDGYKNFSNAVIALSMQTELSLYIVGASLSKKERSYLDSKLPNRWESFHLVSDEDLNGLYNKAVCLIYPSLVEGFGIPILEAQKTGCPVLCVAGNAVSEVGGDGVVYSIDGGAAALQSGLREIVENSTSGLVARGIENAERFSWERSAQQVSKLYDEYL